MEIVYLCNEAVTAVQIHGGGIYFGDEVIKTLIGAVYV